jgi:hypothetical protein
MVVVCVVNLLAEMNYITFSQVAQISFLLEVINDGKSVFKRAWLGYNDPEAFLLF